jgi:phage terminase large subunit
MLRETGGWASFITTPRGNNHAKKLFDIAKADPSWFCELRTLFDTRAYDPEQTIAEERASGMPEALIRQEYLCDWTAANVGSVYGDLLEALEKRGGVAEFDHPEDGVFTSWDLGFTDATGIWFWRVGRDGGVDVIDHYEAHGQPLSHYFDVIEAKPYRYAKHWLPHDARARTLVSGTSILEQALARYPGLVAIAPHLDLLDGIQAGRWLLQKPTRFHSRCVDGVEALKAYRYDYDEDRKTFTRKPVHDWSSHTADAWRYLATVARHSELMTRKPDPEAARKAAAEALRRHVAKPNTLGEPWEIESSTPSRRV